MTVQSFSILMIDLKMFLWRWVSLISNNRDYVTRPFKRWAIIVHHNFLFLVVHGSFSSFAKAPTNFCHPFMLDLT